MRLAKPKRRISKKLDKNRKTLTYDDLIKAFEMCKDRGRLILPANTEIIAMPIENTVRYSPLPKSLQLLNKLKKMR